jgi:hypothetical protein
MPLFMLVLALFSTPASYGQTAAGMAGTVTDQSGAVVPGAEVKLTNKSTGVKYTQVTNGIGAYRFADVPPGAGYEVTFTAKGFTPVVVKDIYLIVATVRTQNVSLTIGATEQIEVSAANSEVTIDTSDATVGNNIDVHSLNSLPVQQRNSPTALFEMQAGVTDTGSVAGARVDQNDVVVDGLDVNDLVTGGVGYNSSANGVAEGIRNQTIVGGAPVDSLEQFTGSVAGGGADSGPGSGGQFSLVTKSGTNKFHGNLNEYNRNTSFVANSWFSNNASPIVPRNHLIQNQFGGNIGGPITIPHFFSGKDRAFFFFDFNDNRVIRSALQQRTVPLDSLRAGNVGFINDAKGDITTLTPAQFKAYDPAGLGTDNTWLTAAAARFPHANNTNSGDGVNSGGYAFNAPDGENATNYVGKVDINLSQKMKIFAKFSFVRADGVNSPNQFMNDPSTNNLSDRSYSFVVGHTWLISPTKTNRVSLGEAVQKLSAMTVWNPSSSSWNPNGTTYYTFADGTGPALASSMYLAPGGTAQRVPVPVLRDDFTWLKGTHTYSFGGSFKDLLIHTTSVTDYNTTELGMGGNVLALCGPTPGDCTTKTNGVSPSATMRPSSIQTTGSEGNLAEYDWDQVFGFMLARVGEVSAVFNYDKNGNSLKQLSGDQRFYRSYQTQLYVQDSWKVTPGLTATYGLSYQFFSVPYETRGLESIEPYSYNEYMQAREQQSALGQSGANAVPLIAYYLGGKGNGSGAPPLFPSEYKNFAPHVGFAWNPSFDKKLVINAGASIAYDRTVITAIQHIQDADSYLFQQPLPLPQGIAGDPYSSFKKGSTNPRLDGANDLSNVQGLVAPATPKAPYEPFVVGGVPNGLVLGSAFNATIDPALKTPYNINFNFGVQRQMRWDMVLKANYVGHLGRRLIAQADVNQVLDFPDSTGGSTQTLGQAMGDLTKQLRAGATSKTVKLEPFFENVMGAGTTENLVQNFGPFVYRGDFGDAVQFLAANGAPLNVGSAAQFSENTFYTNLGSSNYHGLLLTLNKNLSHGLSFDFNYTLSHSIDNTSNFANSQGDTGIGGIGLVCDVVRPRECRAASDFDMRHYITGDGTYQLPFGRKRMFANHGPNWLDYVIGQWDLSGLMVWHTGSPWSTVSNAFVASYSNDAPGILTGNASDVATHITKIAGGGVNIFANSTKAANSFTGPVGFQIGPRNELRGPKFFNTDLGLQKSIPFLFQDVSFKFRADAFNALNHPNFNQPANNVYNGYDQADFTSSSFGVISSTVEQPGNLNNGARVLQLSLRLEF